METLKNFLIFFGCITLFSGCDKERLDDCFRGHGSSKTEVRTTAQFNSIHISGNVIVELIPDTIQLIEVTGGKNFIDQIKTEVSGTRLEIDDNIGCNFVRSYDREYKVKVHFTELRHIEHYAAKDLTCSDTIRSQILDIDKWAGGGDLNLITKTDEVFVRIHAGSGDVKVAGKSRYQYTYQRGFGFMFLSDLLSDELYIDKGGSGDCYVHANNSLSIDFNSEGNLYYSGDPEVNIIRKKRGGSIISNP